MSLKGRDEQRCINSIRTILFKTKENDDVLGITRDLESNIDLYLNPEIRKNIYGLSDKELEGLLLALYFAQPNRNLNNFPDYEYDGWFVEHFRVTSSVENKGSLYERKYGERKQKIRDSSKQKSFKDVIEFEGESFSNDCLFASVLRNINHHLISSEKFGDKYQYGCFVLEYRDNALFSVGSGDKPYRIGTDKKLLLEISNIISKYKKPLFIVFKNGNCVELFSCSNIPEWICSDENQPDYVGRGLIDIYFSEKIGTIPLETVPEVERR